MADDRNGRPSLHPLQYPDLWGDLRLLPHRVGYDPRGHCQSHALLHWPEPQREQGPQPLQTQGLTIWNCCTTSCAFLYPFPGCMCLSHQCVHIPDSHPSIFTTGLVKRFPCTVRPFKIIVGSLNERGEHAFYWGLVGLTAGSNCLMMFCISLNTENSGCALSVTSDTGKRGKWVQSTAPGQWLTCALFPPQVDKNWQIHPQHRTVFIKRISYTTDIRQQCNGLSGFFFQKCFCQGLLMSSSERRCFVPHLATSYVPSAVPRPADQLYLYDVQHLLSCDTQMFTY